MSATRIIAIAAALLCSAPAFAGKKQQVRSPVDACPIVALAAAAPLRAVEIGDDLQNNFKSWVPRYDVRVKVQNWLAAARREGVYAADDTGLIALDDQFDLVFRQVDGKLTITDVRLKASAGGTPETAIKVSVRDKDLQVLPPQIRSAFAEWLEYVAELGLFAIRRDFGGSYHDELLSGDRAGQRSVRLNQQYRAIYRELPGGGIEVLEVNAHNY